MRFQHCALAAIGFAASLALGLATGHADDHGGRFERDVAEAKRLFDQGRAADAWSRLARVLKQADSALEDQPETLGQLSAFAGLVALDLSHLDDAERLFRRSYALIRRAKGNDHPDTLKASRNLAAITAAKGDYAVAEELLTNLLARPHLLGRDEAAEVQVELGNLRRARGQFREAEEAYRNAIAVFDTVSPGPLLANALDALGVALQRQLRFAEAENYHRKAVKIAPSNAGNAQYGVYLGNLASAIEGQGRLAEAENLYRLVLEGARASDRQSVPYAVALNNLARIEFQLEHFDDAADLLRNAVAILEARGRKDHPDYCPILSNLALAEAERGDAASAYALSRRAVVACEQVVGATHPDLVEALNALGRTAVAAGEVSVAADAFRRALAIVERTKGVDHPAAAVAIHNLAGVMLAAGDRSVTSMLRRSLQSAERAGEALDNLRATTLEVLALTELRTGQSMLALSHMRQSTKLTRDRLERALPRRGAAPGSAWSDLRKRFAFHAAIAVQAATSASPTETARLHEESFVTAELARNSSAGRAIAQMAARFATGDDSLARLVRERQDASERWQLLERQQLRDLNHARESNALSRQARADAASKIEEIDRRLAVEFPEYIELANPEPPGVQDTRRLLRPGEAMLAYLVRQEETLIWFLDAKAFTVRRQPIGYAELAERVVRLRQSVEPTADGRIPAFDRNVSIELYRLLIEPIAALLGKVQHVFVVDDGPLRSIPFSLLLSGGAARNEDDWLIRRHALTTLPSASALRALRRFARPAGSQQSFLGFGDPTMSPAVQAVTTRGSSGRRRGGTPSLRALQSLPALPESASELRAIARTLGGGDVFLRNEATETRLKKLDLSRYRYVAFATHTLDADMTDNGAVEPGLVLTQPPEQTVEDDGFLSASEVARLRLDAEFVILSACSTAGADGTSGGEALSGLARAFIYAGSRSLLVSHWPIESNAAVQLTTGMIEELRRDRRIGRAEAIRRSMLRVASMQEKAHPFFWAPFVLVGEGGG